MNDQHSNLLSRELTCKDVHDFLMSYIEGEVTPTERRAFDEHLSGCSSCVRYLDQYKRTVSLGRAAAKFLVESMDDFSAGKFTFGA
mgnify:CR=1 FL=1